MHLGGVAVMLRVAAMIAVVTNKEVLVLATMQSVEQLSTVHDEPSARAHRCSHVLTRRFESRSCSMARSQSIVAHV
jgi:hypothetical protein